MSQRKILALSSSRVGTGGYLEAALPMIKDLLADQPLNIAFIPFAFVDKNNDAFLTMVKEAFKSLPYTINVVTTQNGKEVISNADAIMVSGGNTFKLLHDVYEADLLKLIQERVNMGTPYIGWSAGSNITGKTICTTNDMPIIEPQSFKALAFFPFQINPHYYNVVIEGHNGETRDQRLTEYVKLNPSMPVVCLPEGTALLEQNGSLKLIGITNGLIISNKEGEMQKQDIMVNDDIGQLL